MLLYPLLLALQGERDGLRMFLVGGLTVAWQLCLYSSEYFASPARHPASNASQFYVGQRKRHAIAFWLAALAFQGFVYAPIIDQNVLSLPDNSLDPALHVMFRTLLFMACICVDSIRAVILALRWCAPTLIGNAAFAVTNRLACTVTFALVVVSGSFL
jgi:hypothetical protein